MAFAYSLSNGSAFLVTMKVKDERLALKDKIQIDDFDPQAETYLRHYENGNFFTYKGYHTLIKKEEGIL